MRHMRIAPTGTICPSEDKVRVQKLGSRSYARRRTHPVSFLYLKVSSEKVL